MAQRYFSGRNFSRNLVSYLSVVLMRASYLTSFPTWLLSHATQPTDTASSLSHLVALFNTDRNSLGREIIRAPMRVCIRCTAHARTRKMYVRYQDCSLTKEAFFVETYVARNVFQLWSLGSSGSYKARENENVNSER